MRVFTTIKLPPPRRLGVMRVVVLIPILFLLYLSGCGHAVEDASDAPAPKTPSETQPPAVTVNLSEQLHKVYTKYSQLRAVLVLDSTEYAMDIHNGIATWQQADLPITNPYTVTVRFDVALDSNPDSPLILAQVQDDSHDFSEQSTKTFKVEELVSTSFDDDGDKMDNLVELDKGGNPYSSAPTITSVSQVTVREKSLAVFLKVEAISPRPSPVWNYTIEPDIGDHGLFSLDANSGDLKFNTPVTYNVNTNNVYNVTIEVNDGTLTSQQSVNVTLTDFLDLNVTLGLKQLAFQWHAHPEAAYYKILQSVDNWGTFSELPNGGHITNLYFNHPLALHQANFDPATTQFKLEAYTSADRHLETSPSTQITTSLRNAIGYFKAANTLAGDWFGYALAISADGSTLAVGAPGQNNNSGAVYVFSRSSCAWRYQGVVKAPNAEVGDWFGAALAMSADGKTLAVGAFREASAATGITLLSSTTNGIPGDNNNALDAGAVYIFGRATNGDPFQARAYVKAANVEAGDLFGRALTISSDGNTLAVAAFREDSATTGVTPLSPGSNGIPGDNNDATYAGAVYVYGRATNADPFQVQAYVKAPNAGEGDYFGATLVLSIDGNTLAVGARYEASATTGVIPLSSASNGIPGDNNDAPNAGAVYVYGRTTNANPFQVQVYVKAANAETDDLFGAALTISADGNTLVVGAWKEDGATTTTGVTPLSSAVNGIPGDNNSALDAGAVYVFDRAANADPFQARAYIKAVNSGSSDWFGRALSISASGNTLAVGALHEDSAATGITPLSSASNGIPGDFNDAHDAGAVYVFSRTTNSEPFQAQAYVKAANTDASDYFGFALAMGADGNTLAVGASSEDNTATGVTTPPPVNGGVTDNNDALNSGAVYLY